MSTEPKPLLCFVHPDTKLEFPRGYWDDIERVDDHYCPRDYCQWVTRESHDRLMRALLRASPLQYPRARWTL